MPSGSLRIGAGIFCRNSPLPLVRGAEHDIVDRTIGTFGKSYQSYGDSPADTVIDD